MKEIQLTQGEVALVNEEVFEELNRVKWYALKVGHTFYAVRNVQVGGKRTTEYMHNIIIARKIDQELLRGKEINHIDGNGLNNTFENLRIATRTQIRMNEGLRRDNTSGFKGVSWDRRRIKWFVAINIDKKRKYLGRYKNKIDAVKTYNAAAIKYYKKFARINEEKSDALSVGREA